MLGPLLVVLSACRPTEPLPLHPPAPPDPIVPDAPPVGIESVTVARHTLENSREITLALSAASTAALLCVDADDPDERHLLESPSAVDPVFRLQGLRFGATYRCVVGPPGAEQPLDLEIGPPPPWTPTFEVTGDPSDGYLLTAVEPTGGCGPLLHLAVFDTSGGLRWHFPIVGSDMGVEVQHAGDGILVYGGTTGEPGPVGVDLWDGVVRAPDLPGDWEFHHDAKPLPDGRILTLERRPNTDGDASWTGFGARTSDPWTGEVDFAYDSQQGVDEGDLHASGLREDAWHANSVDLLDSGDGPVLYVSLCYAYRVVAIDAATGHTRWVFGPNGDFSLVDAGGQPLPDSEFSQCQHGLEMSPDGTRLLVYDNGRDRSESRAAEYGLDPAAGVATLLWTWTDGWKEATLGDVDRLPNGNVLVTQGHPDCWSPGDRSEVVEVDPATNAVAWRLSFVDPSDAIYRSERLDGCEIFGNVGLCPALEARWAALAPGGWR